MRATAYSAVTRAVAVALQLLLALNLAELAVRFILDLAAPAETPRAWEQLVVRRVVFFTLAPWLLLAGIRLLARVRVELGPEAVTVRGWRSSTTIPRASIVGVEPWRVPLPRPGIRLRLASGRAFRLGLAGLDPSVWARELAPALRDGVLAREAAALRETRLLRHAGIKFGLVPIVPVFILFRLQQIISGGDILGEYRFYGLKAYLGSLATIWLFVLSYLLVYAAAWRAVVELIALPVARLAPRATRRVRWTLELLAAAGFLGGIAFVLLRLFS
jgi:hypothetical protein